MMNRSTEESELVEELSRQLVEKFAPEEAEIFDELYSDYQQDPTPPSFQHGSDDALGSGIGEAVIAITPAATAMASAVISFVVSEVLKAAKTEAGEKIKEKVKAVFSPGVAGSTPDPGKPAPLTHEQMEQIRKLAIKRGTDFGLPAEEAKKMALALIGSLAMQ
jgi:hypothetical protein